jgi:hypothetical protein
MDRDGGHVQPEWNAIMNTDVEDLLREGMDRFTRDLRAPAGLTHGAARRHRRRLARRTVAAGAAALTAVAVALVAVAVAGARPDGAGRSVVLAAYVVKRVDSALSAVEPGEIAQLTITRSAEITGDKTVTTTAEEWSYGNQWRSLMSSPTGTPEYDEGFSSSSVYTLVSYVTRTWASQPGLGRPAAPAFTAPPVPVLGLAPALMYSPRYALAFGAPLAPLYGPGGCKPVVAGLPALFQPGLPGIGFPVPPGIGFFARVLPTARALRSAISCGALAVAGRQRVDGIEAIELTSRRSSPISETIWVSPGTYLPVRMMVRSALGYGGVRQTADITWLPPNAQNLAKLTVPIPAGFRKVSVPQAVLPILKQLGYGLALAP